MISPMPSEKDKEIAAESKPVVRVTSKAALREMLL
jgi:hypothetical protein